MQEITDFSNIPQELKMNGLWCCWKYSDKGKIPYDVKNDTLARTNDRNTFYSYGTVLRYVPQFFKRDSNGRLIGGLGLGIFNGFCGVDIDDCISENGEINDIALEFIRYFDSYTEKSPSGNGIRIIFKLKDTYDKQKYYIRNDKIHVEIYCSGMTSRFLTVTGNMISEKSVISEVDITKIFDKYMLRPLFTGNSQVKTINDFLEKDEVLSNYWNKTAPGSGSDESQSDLALCTKLAFYLRNDIIAINNAFMSSPYYTSKDRKHKAKWEARDDYRMKVLQMCQSEKVYDPNYSSNKQLVAEIKPHKLERYYSLDDTGNAERFIDEFRNEVRYNVDDKMWMIWNGTKWQYDVFGDIRNYIQILVEELKEEIKNTPYDPTNDKDPNIPKIEALSKTAKRLRSSSGKDCLLKEAQSMRGIPCINNDFDKDPYIFNTLNGVYDLRTGEVVKNSRDFYCNKIAKCKVSFEKPLKWLAFIKDIHSDNMEEVEFIRSWFGYCMTGLTKEHKMLIQRGEGRNGKSLMNSIVAEAMGDYAGTINKDILINNKYAKPNTFDLADTKGLRFITTTEPERSDQLAESQVKLFTSGFDKIRAAKKYCNAFEFELIGKIVMSCNDIPKIAGTDDAIWERLYMIEYKKQYLNENDNKNLVNELREELPQILGWLIRAAVDYNKEGMIPAMSMIKNRKDYRMDMDIIEQWLEERCEFGEKYFEKSSDLFQDYCIWLEARKERVPTATAFGRSLTQKAEKYLIERRRTSVGFAYIGMRFKKVFDNKIYNDLKFAKTKINEDEV